MNARKSVLVRMSPDLWKELNRWASEDFRSLNGHIEFLLHKAVQQRKHQDQATKKNNEPS